MYTWFCTALRRRGGGIRLCPVGFLKFIYSLNYWGKMEIVWKHTNSLDHAYFQYIVGIHTNWGYTHLALMSSSQCSGPVTVLKAPGYTSSLAPELTGGEISAVPHSPIRSLLTSLGIEGGQLWEPDVIANPNTNFAPLWSESQPQWNTAENWSHQTCIKREWLIPASESFRLLKPYLARYVNVKQVHLSRAKFSVIHNQHTKMWII